MPEEAKQADGVGSTSPSKKETDKKKKNYGPDNAKGFAPRAPKFEGKSPDLKGHIYDASDARQSDQFIKTTKEIAEFVGRTYKYGGDIRLSVETLTIPIMTPPLDYEEGAGRTTIRIWEKSVDEHVRRMTQLTENIKTLYSLVWGQCSDVVRQKAESHDSFEATSAAGDGLALLTILKGISFHFQSQKYVGHSIHEALKRYYNCSQGRFATTQAYMEHFQNIVDVVTHSGGSISGHPGLKKMIMNEKKLTALTMSKEDEAAVESETLARSTAIAFLLGCDRARYGKLIEDLENDFLQGRNNYPMTVVAAYNVVTNWKQENRFGWRAPTADGVAFANIDDAKKAPAKQRNVTCHKCGVKGHYATDCPELAGQRVGEGKSDATTLLLAGIESGEFDSEPVNFTFITNGYDGITCQMGQDGRLPKTWILLDNQSTVDVFYNADLLTDIRKGTGNMDIHCNAGVASTDMIGELQGYGTVWYHPDGIANILSLSRVKEQGYRVTYDSEGGNHFTVMKSDGSTRVFNESKRGLYFLDTDKAVEHETLMINTVADNRSNYTNRAYSRALQARKIQQIVGRPSTREFMTIVDKNLLPNCPISRADIVAAEKNFRAGHWNTQGEDSSKNITRCGSVRGHNSV